MRALSNDQVNVLAYVCGNPGVTTPEVAAAIGLPQNHARRSLEALYAKRLLWRQHNLVSFKNAIYSPEAVSLLAYQRAQETQP